LASATRLRELDVSRTSASAATGRWCARCQSPALPAEPLDRPGTPARAPTGRSRRKATNRRGQRADYTGFSPRLSS